MPDSLPWLPGVLLYADSLAGIAPAPPDTTLVGLLLDQARFVWPFLGAAGVVVIAFAYLLYLAPEMPPFPRWRKGPE